MHQLFLLLEVRLSYISLKFKKPRITARHKSTFIVFCLAKDALKHASELKYFWSLQLQTLLFQFLHRSMSLISLKQISSLPYSWSLEFLLYIKKFLGPRLRSLSFLTFLKQHISSFKDSLAEQPYLFKARRSRVRIGYQKSEV